MNKKLSVLLLVLFLLVSMTPISVLAAEKPIEVFIDGAKVDFTINPIVENGTTLVQFRPIFEKLGLKVSWEQSTQTVLGEKDGLLIKLVLGNKIANVNGQKIEIPVAPKAVNGNTIVPLRFIGEASGKDVIWDQKTQTINIVSKVKNTAKGNLKGTVTWQYNKIIGTKADVNAGIYLIPSNFDKNSITQSEAELFTLIGDCPKDSGLFYTKANGYGNYEINNIPAGEYFVVIVSANTTRDFYKDLSEYTTTSLEPLMRDWENFSKFRLNMNKHEVKKITIEENQTLDYSIDFGFTFI